MSDRLEAKVSQMEKGFEEPQEEPEAPKVAKMHLFKELPAVFRVLVISACTLFILAMITAWIEYAFFLYCYDRWWNPSDYMPRHGVGKPAMYPYTIIWILSLFGLGIFILDFFAGLVYVALGKLRARIHVRWALIQLLLFLLIAWVILRGWPGTFE
jgi:hypothetical protein